MINKLNDKIKKFLIKIKNMLFIKIPIAYPVLEGNLLNNRIALITGGSCGIGFSIAQSFLKNGASVIITGRSREKLEKATIQLKNYAKNNQFIKSYVFDIGDVKSIKANLKKIINDIDKDIDILVNNAGIGLGSSIGTTNIDDFENVIQTNLEGTYFLSQEMFNYMKKNNIKGNILNIASSSSLRPATNAYSLSKWSVLGLTKGLAKKAIVYGIVVNGIAPGPTFTPMLVKNSKNISLIKSPAGRYILPEEVANLSTILVSNMGRMIIGDTLFITGGAGIITYDDIKY